MAVDAAEPYRPVATTASKVGGGRKRLSVQLLVPAAPQIQPASGLACGIVLRAAVAVSAMPFVVREIQLEREKSETHDMAMGIDQARQKRPALAVDLTLDRSIELLRCAGTVARPCHRHQ